MVEDDRELVLEPVRVGQVLARQGAEPRRTLAIEREPDGRLKVLVGRRIGPVEVLAGHVLAILDAQNVLLDPPRPDLLGTDDRVAGRRVRRVAAADAAGIVLDPVRGDRLESLRRVQSDRVRRVLDDGGRHRVLDARGALAGQLDPTPRVDVFLPVLREVGHRRVGEFRIHAVRRLAEPSPEVALGGVGQPVGAKRSIDDGRVVLAVGEDAKLQRADVGEVPLDLLDLLGARFGENDLDPVAGDLADRDFADARRVHSMLQRRDQLVHAEVRVFLHHLVDEDRAARQVNPQLELLARRVEGDQAERGGHRDECELGAEVLHDRSLRPDERVGPCRAPRTLWRVVVSGRPCDCRRSARVEPDQSVRAVETVPTRHALRCTARPRAVAGRGPRATQEVSEVFFSFPFSAAPSSTRAMLALLNVIRIPLSSSTRKTIRSAPSSTETTVP